MNVSPLDPALYAIEVEEVAREGGWTVRHLSPCLSGTRPWFHRAVANDPTAPRLYLSAGIHGDEVAGPLAALRMLREPGFFKEIDVTLFPILNPDGIARNLRGNADGIDLNRDYRNPKSEEIRSHIEAIDTLAPFAAALFLHEDYEGTGAYLYEFNDSNLRADLGASMIKAMGRHVPIDLRAEIEEVVASGGVLSRRDVILKYGSIEERPDWPEAIYLGLHHTRVSYTTETPLPLPLEQRIEAQLAATATLIEELKAAR
jgi:protein MpaA